MAKKKNAIGKRLRELRFLSGITVTDLAERAGMEPPSISRFERGDRVPTLDSLLRLARALGVDVSKLIPEDR